MMSPVNSSGTMTSRAQIGSSSVTPAFSTASLIALDPASWNAMSEESTEWYLPS